MDRPLPCKKLILGPGVVLLVGSQNLHTDKILFNLLGLNRFLVLKKLG
jgi:hypothetical protein